jgi:hypothetical protein
MSAASSGFAGDCLGHCDLPLKHSHPFLKHRDPGKRIRRFVLADGTVVGRIMMAAAAPVGAPWLWTFGQHEGRTPTHGYARGRDGGVREELAAGVSSKIGKSAFGDKPENIWSL